MLRPTPRNFTQAIQSFLKIDIKFLLMKQLLRVLHLPPPFLSRDRVGQEDLKVVNHVLLRYTKPESVAHITRQAAKGKRRGHNGYFVLYRLQGLY